MTKPTHDNSVPRPFLPGFFLRARLWWLGGILTSLLLPTLLLLDTPVEFQSTVRIEPTNLPSLGASPTAPPTRQGALLAALSSLETRQRVAASFSKRKTRDEALPSDLDSAEAFTQTPWTALLGARFRVVASPSTVHVITRGVERRQVTPLAQAIARAGVAVLAERQLRQDQEALRQVAKSMEQLRPSIAALSAQGIARYDQLIQHLGQRLQKLDRSKLVTVSERLTVRRQLEVEFQAAVLQRAELETGLPMGQASFPHRLLGVNGQRWQELETRHAALAAILAEPSSGWEIATDLQGPPRQLQRTLMMPMLLGFFLPLTLVAVARLLIELPS